MAESTKSYRDENAVAAAAGDLRLGLRVRLKYAIDRLFGIFLLVIISPLLVAIVLWIWLEDGSPAIFRQARPGLAGREFQCLKFRTMIVDADKYVDDQGRPTRNRITSVGMFLRKTSLDELPQLLNIVRGDMSFIGPRPPIIIHLQRYTDAQMKRFRMKPGITGLAQVNGRNTIPWSKRLLFDNAYIDNYTFLGDAIILIKTVVMVLKREGIVIDRNPEQVDDLAPVGEWDKR